MSRKPKSPQLTAAELKRRIPDVARVASNLYGIEFRNGVARCPFPDRHKNGDRDPSLRHDRKKDRVFCASQQCFGEKGADAIGLVQVMDGCKFLEAIKKLAECYGVSTVVSGAPSPPAATRSAATDVPADEKLVTVDEVRQRLLRQGYHAVAEFPFGVDLRKVRFEHNTKLQEDKKRPEKTFRWEHLSGGTWNSGDGGVPKPLYVNSLFRERDQIGLVIGFEGEAKADIAGPLGLAAFSFKDITVQQAAALADCEVVLWPDNDDSGKKQAESAARIIADAGQCRSIKILAPPEELPNAADIIDAVQDLGWDSERVLRFVETASVYSEPEGKETANGSEQPNSSVPGTERQSGCFPFEVSDDGVFFLKKDGDGVTEPIRLAARVDVVALTRDEAGNNWGRLLRWQDHEGRRHQWTMPMEALAADQGGVRARLLSEGLPFITTNVRYRERFSEYLQTFPVQRRVRCVPCIGWQGDSYVLPDATIGPAGSQEILYQPPHEALHNWNASGTDEEWREHLGSRCSGNSRLILVVSCAFAGPVLRLVNAESGGIHFHGLTSTGKSTALVVGGSVCGGGGKSGFVQPWRTTVNGLEASAEAHNDATLFLDELAQADPREVAETAYLLGNGQGKSRMTRSIAMRKKLTWTLLYVSSGEITLAEHAASVGKRVKGGAEVRLLNVESDAGAGLGLFETLHGAESADAFVQQLKDAAQRYYGAPFRAFLTRLTKDRPGIERRIRAAKEAFFLSSVPADSTGEVKRAADRFALIGAAGELATEWGLTGWKDGEATNAAQRCFQNWLDRRGTTGASDVEAGVRQVRSFLGSHGTSRFQGIHTPSRSDNGNDQVTVIRDRVGFRRWNSEAEETEYLILIDLFRDEVCKGHSSRAVLRELAKRGYLVRDGQNLTIKARLPELGTPRVYCIRGAILEGNDADQP